MPNNIRAILSVLVALVAVAVFYFEHRAGADTLRWIGLGLGIFMIGTVWLLPEAKRRTDSGGDHA